MHIRASKVVSSAIFILMTLIWASSSFGQSAEGKTPAGIASTEKKVSFITWNEDYLNTLKKEVPAFEKETGIKVKAVYDSEAVKTVGLANRLLAERSHPQCDVFWGNEEMRTRQLAAAQDRERPGEERQRRSHHVQLGKGLIDEAVVVEKRRLQLARFSARSHDLAREVGRDERGDALRWRRRGTTAGFRGKQGECIRYRDPARCDPRTSP